MAKTDIYESDNTSSGATTIAVGAVQTHSITAGDVDWVKFTISTAGTYTLQTSGAGDTYMYVYDSSLSQLDNDDDDGADRNARIQRYFSAGTYYAQIKGYSSTTTIDSYRLALYSGDVDTYENDDTRFGATTLTVGSSQSHTIHSATDEDWYKFTVSSDGFYSVRTTGGDTILQLYSFEGQAFGYNDDRGNGDLGSSGTVQLYANTTYYARVTSYGTNTFSYTISLSSGVIADAYESNGDNYQPGATALSLNSVQVHTIHGSSDVDWVKFTISEAGYYYLFVDTSDRAAGQMQFSLYNSSGSQIDLSSLSAGLYNGNGFDPSLTANFGTGTYYVRLSAANSGTVAGEYSVSLSKVSSIDYADSDEYEDDGDWRNANVLTLGTPQTHSLNVRGGNGNYYSDVDWFVFTPSVTGMYKFTVSGTRNPTSMTVGVADEYGFPNMPWGGNSGINPSAENYMQAGQTYYILMTAEGSRMNVDSYTITATRTVTYSAERDNYEPDNSLGTASAISVGETQAHSIHAIGDQDWMKFTPTASGYYTFYTGARNGNAGDADMLLALYDSNGTLLIYDDDSFAGFNAMMSYSLTAGQTYYVVALAARSNTVVPYYTVSVMQGIIEDQNDIYMDERSINDNTRGNAMELSLGQPQAHTIHSSSDVDWVGFHVPTAGAYTIQTTGSDDTLIYVYDENGNYITYDDDSGIGRNASVTMNLTANAIYYARVSAYGGALIPLYKLTLTEATGGGGDSYESDNTMGTAKGIVAGETQSHSIHVAGDVDWLEFSPIQSGAYQIQTTGNGDMKLDLYNASGALIASDDDSGTGLNARIGYTLSANTTYYIKAYAYNTSAVVDSYALNISLLQTSELGDEYENDDTPALAKPIQLGQTQAHSIHVAGDVDWVTFTPTVNGEYTIQTTGSGLNCDTQLYIYDSLAHAQSGTTLQWDDDSGTDRNALVTRLLNAGTTYYIKSKAYSTYTIPSYGIKVTRSDGRGSATYGLGDEYESDDLSGLCKPVAVGREYTHSIHANSDTDWIRFFTHQTGMYTIQSTGQSDMSFIVYRRIPGGALVPYLNGVEVSNGGADQNALFRARLETDNWYYVRVTTTNRETTTSSYGIRVDIDSSSVKGDAYETAGGKSNDNAPSRATWVTLGATQVHSIHTPGDTDWYVYKSSSATRVLFTASNDDSKEMRLYLYRQNSDGTQTYIGQSSIGSYGYTSIQLDAVANATYYLRAQALSPTQTVSSYRFSTTYVKDGYEDDDTSARATTLSVGTAQTHNIHSQTDVDWYKIVVTASGIYEFETSGNGDTYGVLYQNTSSGNTLLTQTGSGGSGSNFKISRALGAGTYYLRVSGESGKLVESYTIAARRPITQYDEPNDTRNAATNLSVGTTKTGSFHSVSDVDYYKIANASVGTYTITASSSGVSLSVYSGSSSTALATGNGAVSFSTTSAQTLYIRAVDANSDLRESYTLSAEYAAPVQTNPKENYAVLFSGGADPANNWNTFIVNFAWVYSALRDEYGIPADHIYVLYADGTNTGTDMLNLADNKYYNTDVESFCPGANIYAATESNLRSVMSRIASLADSNDHVLVYTFDHGADTNGDNSSSHGGEVIVPWNPQSTSDYIFASEFASMASNVNAGYQTYLFAQCYSGGILDALNKSRSGINIYGAAAADHWHTASAGITNTSNGADISGFNYQVAYALTQGVSTTSELTTAVRRNPFRASNGGYETGSNFQIFARS